MKNLIFAVIWMLLVCSCTNNSSNNNTKKESHSNADSCKWIVHTYHSGTKSSEGLLCNHRRQGLWKDWYTDGTLIDSGLYNNGYYIYRSDMLKKLKGTINFKGNPLQFFKDSVYLFDVSLNQAFHHWDIEPYYLDYEKRDGKKYLFKYDDEPDAPFLYAIKFIKSGKMKLMFCLHERIASKDGMDSTYTFYDKEVEVLGK